MADNKLVAGSFQVDVSPARPLHLYGYPHVERTSTGVHDPLWASALYLGDGANSVLFVAVDIIFVPKDLVSRARRRIRAATGVPESHILISATHTHSGPGTVRYLSNEADPTVPPPDSEFLRQLEDGIVEAATEASAHLVPAEIALVFGDGSCTGSNRRDPRGTSNPRVPVLAVRKKEGQAYLAVMLICSMHPTVLHEDSTVISGDFPGAARRYLQSKVLGDACPVLHHCGASGNQSPRHVVRSTTMDEAERIGNELGASIAWAISEAEYRDTAAIRCDTAEVELPLRTFAHENVAEEALATARARFVALTENGADRATVRTAECDVFGAEETLTLARAAAEGRIEAYAQQCMPAEVQRIAIGPWNFVALPGELFVEFALEIEAKAPNTFVITLANGELQGYLVTQESVEEGGYEASNALFKSPDGGDILVKTALDLVKRDSAASRNE